MNSSGVGACLNFLNINKTLRGIPIHIVLRAILDSTSIESARALIKRAGLGKAGNILMGDQKGVCFNIEYAGDESFETELSDDVMIHTNHCLGEYLNAKEDFPSSYARYAAAKKLTESLDDFGVYAMQNILSDRSNSGLPIYRTYVADPELGTMGTICTIVMDLQNKKFYIRKGNSLDDKLMMVFDGGNSSVVGDPPSDRSNPKQSQSRRGSAPTS